MNTRRIIKQLIEQATESQSRSSSRDGSKSHDSNRGDGSKNLLGDGAGALGILLGAKRRRGMGGKALKYGAIAKVGKLAWDAWQDHKSSNEGGGAVEEGQPFEQLQGQVQEDRSKEILQAMIMAARADGHIDESERAQIAEQIEAMGADDELKGWIDQQFKLPLDAQALAKQADSPQAAREIYLVSVAMTDEQNPMERAWLNQLAEALKLDPALVSQLERQAA